MLHHLKIWVACAKYSITRTLMFRGDFYVWSLVELFWMTVLLTTNSVIYEHTNGIAGWSKYQMVLLLGTSMVMQRILFGFFWSSIFEMGRNIRTGNFDFYLAQPGNVMFMATTRKLDPDSLLNSIVAISVVIYACKQLHLEPSFGQVMLYILMLISGVILQYSILVISISLAFWLTSAQGIEGIYFTLSEFSRLPRAAFKGPVSRFLFVWALPVVIVTNVPANLFVAGFNFKSAAWLFGSAVAWFIAAVIVFHRGLRRYTSASS
jgi:ABC-2 type transport system permease protein